MTETRSLSAKIGQSLFALLFAISFGYFAYVTGLRAMAQVVQGWWRADQLVAVQAKVVDVDLLEDQNDDGSVLRTTAEFTYQYDGKSYRSKRINIGGDGGDNIDDYQHHIHDSLLLAMSNEQNVTLWMDPLSPDFAVYDRQVRPKRVLLIAFFSVMFSSVSVGALWFFLQIWRHDDFEDYHRLAVQRGRFKVQGSLELEPQNSGVLISSIFTLIWNLVSLCISIPVMAQHWKHGPSMAWLVLLFPAIGLLLICLVMQGTYLRWRIGSPTVRLSQLPQIGMSELAVHLHFAPPFGQRMQTGAAVYPVKLELQCLHEDATGDDATTTNLWSTTLREVQLMKGALRLDFNVGIPEGLPATVTLVNKKVRIIWKLIVTTLGTDLVYELPVQQGLGDNADITQLLRKQRDNLLVYSAPRTSATAAKQTRRWVVAFGVFFILIGIVAVSFFNHGESSDKQENTSQIEESSTGPKIETLAQLRSRIDAGADVNALDEQGRGLLMQAADEVNLDKVKFLLKHGAKVDLSASADAQGNGDRTALFAAINHDAVEIVRTLAEAGADLHKASNQVWTPVHYAAYNGAMKSLHYLYEHGQGIDEAFAGGRGSTPLMIAAQYNQLTVIAFLLQVGADKTKKDMLGEDACGYAHYFKQAQAAQSLECH